MAKPLEGVRVLDFTHMLSGPLGTYQLVLLGAEVIKIEQIGCGDAMRHGPGAIPGKRMAPAFAGLNAGKQSVAMDLKHPRGLEVALTLATQADVIVENFRPGVMEKMGLGYSDICRINPKIIYCSVTGYGQRGPFRDWPAYDHVVQAVTGMTMLSGEGDEPVRTGFPLVDAATGMATATAVLAALLRCRGEGTGQHIDVSMIEAASSLMFSMLTAYMGTGEVPRATGNRGFTGSPGAGTFKTRDGWLAVGANTPAQFARLCGLIGLADLPGNPDLVEPPDGNAGFVRARDDAAVRRCLEEGLAAHGARHWETVLNGAGIPAAHVRNVGEFADEILPSCDSAILNLPAMSGYPGGMRTLNVGFRTSHDMPGTKRPAPLLGEHTVQVLRRAGLSPDRIQELQDLGAICSTEKDACSAPVA